MPTHTIPNPAGARRQEAARLVVLAKGMLTAPQEEMAALYLDHALAALDDIACTGVRSSTGLGGSASQAAAPAPGRD
jgi:hypothetical protein